MTARGGARFNRGSPSGEHVHRLQLQRVSLSSTISNKEPKMIKVGMNFLTEPASAGGEGRRMYTKTFDMPAVPRAFEQISNVTLAADDPGVLPGTVTKVTWT